MSVLLTGSNGKKGVHGLDGRPGAAGPAGEPGRDGLDGKAGVPGFAGSQGLPVSIICNHSPEMGSGGSSDGSLWSKRGGEDPLSGCRVRLV